MGSATFNSIRTAISGQFAALPGILILACSVLAESSQAAEGEWRSQSEVAFSRAADQLKASPANTTALWQFARATFDLGEYATNNTERAELARRGIEAARKAVAQAPDLAAAHYYLAMNLGQLARTRYLSALKIVDEMESEFIKASKFDPKFDYAGADRSLGLLYRDAPTIGSVGSRRNAEHHMQAAVKLAPEYPENRLNLIESELKWGDRNGALREFKLLSDGWEKAKKDFSGPQWNAAWADWQARYDRIHKRLDQGLPGIKSPRER